MISSKKWQTYIQRLAEIDQKAEDLMQEWIDANGLQDNDALIEHAYALATKYGEASGELASEMYDMMAEAQGAMVPPAVPADTATIDEVARDMMYGKYHSPSQISQMVGRRVRQAGADTMVQNAGRDHAEWAWVPQGDTCAFCITLASRGWQGVSKKILKGNHAEHIHSNCDCTFAIAHNEKAKREYDAVYDPDKYLEMYNEAGGDINAMRRMRYQQNQENIRTQQNVAYQSRKLAEQSRSHPGDNEATIISPIIDKEEYKERIDKLGENTAVSSKILHESRNVLYRRNGTMMEDMIYLNPDTNECLRQRLWNVEREVYPTEKMKNMLLNSSPRTIIGIHNHPSSQFPSIDDLQSAKSYKYGIILCHNGVIIKYSVDNEAEVEFADMLLNRTQRDYYAGKDISENLGLLKSAGVHIEVID